MREPPHVGVVATTVVAKVDNHCAGRMCPQRALCVFEERLYRLTVGVDDILNPHIFGTAVGHRKAKEVGIEASKACGKVTGSRLIGAPLSSHALDRVR